MPKGIEIGTHSLCFGRFIFLSPKLSILCAYVVPFLDRFLEAVIKNTPKNSIIKIFINCQYDN